MSLSLEAAALSVRFGKVSAIERVTLSLPFGTHALITGEAATGKTTLLKALAALQRPSEGSVRWNELDVWTLGDGERREKQAALGFVFQTDALFDSMSVLENVKLPLLRRGVAVEEAQTRAEQALEQVGLGAAANKHPEELSGGMKKRAGIARAIVARPDVLLADDPFAGLDPDTEAQIAALLLAVAKNRTLIAALPDPVPSLPLPVALRLEVQGAAGL